MKVFLDANLLIYLTALTGDERAAMDAFFRGLLREDLYANLLVLDETLYISQSRYGVTYATTLAFLKATLLPYVALLPVEDIERAAMERYLAQYPMKPSDAIHLATMERQGIVHIASEDRGFDHVTGIRRLWLEPQPKKRR